MTYKTYIGFNDEYREHILVSCSDIEQEDSTFKWRVIKPFGKLLYKYDWILVVESLTKDQAHKRGTWLKYNLGLPDLLYWVKEVLKE